MNKLNFCYILLFVILLMNSCDNNNPKELCEFLIKNPQKCSEIFKDTSICSQDFIKHFGSRAFSENFIKYINQFFIKNYKIDQEIKDDVLDASSVLNTQKDNKYKVIAKVIQITYGDELSKNPLTFGFRLINSKYYLDGILLGKHYIDAPADE